VVLANAHASEPRKKRVRTAKFRGEEDAIRHVLDWHGHWNNEHEAALQANVRNESPSSFGEVNSLVSNCHIYIVAFFKHKAPHHAPNACPLTIFDGRNSSEWPLAFDLGCLWLLDLCDAEPRRLSLVIIMRQSAPVVRPTAQRGHKSALAART
jgi:hypothetical protein